MDISFEISVDPYKLGQKIGSQLNWSSIETLLEGIFDNDLGYRRRNEILDTLERVWRNEKT